MNGLICHDSRMNVDTQGKYYKGSMAGNHYARYFQIADKINIVMRTLPVDERSKKNLNLVDIPNFEVISCPTIMSLKGFLFNRRKAKKIIRNQVKNADFIIAKLPGFFGSIACKYAKKYNKPYLVELGGCPWDAFWNHGISGKIIAPFQYFKTKRILKDAPYALYVTNEFLQNRYPTNGKSVNCSNVILTEFEDEVLDRRLRKIKKSADKFIIGTIGAINVKYKGQEYIIEALGHLKEQGITNIKYQMVGGGDQTYLKSIAEKFRVTDQVEIIGSLPHDKVFEWLETIDIYVQPSRTEGLPRALIEAMSRAVPAFGAKTGGIPELLEPEYIFSYNGNYIEEICTILTSFTNTTMQQQAKRNYNESKKYDKKVIESRRMEFYSEFAKGINENL